MKAAVNKMVALYLKYRQRKIRRMLYEAEVTQKQILHNICKSGSNCAYGYQRRISQVQNYAEFQQAIPVNQYNDLEPYIQEMMLGKQKTLCADPVNYFARSSGTSNSRSKYIPVTKNFLFGNHIKGNWDMVNFIYGQKKDAKIFYRKNLLMGGTISRYDRNPSVEIGDITGIMIKNIPPIGRPFYSPDFGTALMANWDEKIERMAEICARADITLAAGVPTWSMVLFNRLLEKSKALNMLEIWPNAMAYVHGGVNFEPYRSIFENYFPSPEFQFLQAYNASEGYIALQDIFGRDDMLLLVDNENFFEFIPLDDYHKGDRQAIGLGDVEHDVDYVLLLSNTSGMWRYVIGDTVAFTNTNPYRLKVTGRINQFINAFGEELMVVNAEAALAMLSRKYNVVIQDYTVAPKYLTAQEKGRHEWLIEFKKAPKNISEFAVELDLELQRLNSDYETKREKDLALESLQIYTVPLGTFEKWYRSKGKYGSQHKVPRLSNDRKLFTELEQFILS